MFHSECTCVLFLISALNNFHKYLINNFLRSVIIDHIVTLAKLDEISQEARNVEKPQPTITINICDIISRFIPLCVYPV